MFDENMMQKLIILSVISTIIVLLLTFGISSLERRLLYYPTHRSGDNGLEPWTRNGELIGYSRNVRSPKNVWLMLHGNGGQASDRVYAIPSFSTEDSVFILEYPGYGNREGVPSKEAFNRAAKEAYLLLRDTYTKIPVCIAGESIGSGPASFVAGLSPAPDKLVLIAPFDQLRLVAKDHFPSFLVDLILKDDWDNVESLSHYPGPVEIFGSSADNIIPNSHAKALAAVVRSSKFVLIEGGHNDWAVPGRVRIMNP
jgi:hypothetical protein